MNTPLRKTIGELEAGGALIAIQDGNHGEKHPKTSDYVEEGIPFIMANNLGAGFVDLIGCSKITQNLAEKLRIGFSKSGDVLLTHKGTVGNVAVVGNVEPYVMLTPQVTYYRVNSELLSNDFLAYAFRDPVFQREMKSLAEQSTRPYIGVTAQRRLKLNWQPIESQKLLVERIKPYDDLIKNNRRRIALLEQAARLLYREWFVHFRFPGHETARFVDGLPEGWTENAVFDVVDVLSGGTPKTKKVDYWDGNIPFFTPKDTGDNLFAFETEKMITTEGLKSCNTRLYEKYTLFITARGTVGKLRLAQRPMAMNQSCYALQSKTELSQQFLYFSISERVKNFKGQAGGAVFDAIVVDTFKKIQMITPTPDLIDRFSKIAEDTLFQIDKLSSQTRQLTAALDLLLPRLMDGRISV